MNTRLLTLALMIWTSIASAREWHSAAGDRSLTGELVKINAGTITLSTGKGAPLVLKLEALSAEDQAFVREAQPMLDASTKLGPKTFEVSKPLANGAICRMGNKMGNGSVIFIGESFILFADPATIKRGDHLNDQRLFFAGTRTFHPTKGDVSQLRCYALTIDAAKASSADAADIYEPTFETVEARGLGVAVGEGGLVLVDAALLEGATGFELDMGAFHHKGTVVAVSRELGVAVLQGDEKLTPVQLTPRMPITLNQPIQAVAFGLSKTGKSIGEATVTKGTITKLPNAEHKHVFEYNAERDPVSLGGLVIGEKGDVLGMMLTPALIAKPAKTKRLEEVETPVAAAGPNQCVRSDEIALFLKTVPKTIVSKIPKSADPSDTVKSLRPSVFMVKAFRESIKEVPPPVAKTASKAKAKAKP